MSIESNSEVKSKYFNKNSMDESLTDFQEVKKSCKGPKTIQKSKVKKTKKIKGQKDIRTALKGKKNELISYSKQFDDVCKTAGVDVDSEQLQLAIALSKSLQAEPETSQSSCLRDQVSKIRTTLKEYGFQVPEGKITKKTIKKHKRKYKLLLITEAERHQVITDRYSKILLENINSPEFVSYKQDSVAPLFYISTNISYESLKDNNIFYVNDLVEKSTTFGSLLRDWSTIPGRPSSPGLEPNKMDFKTIDCTQNELDVILSGTIDLTQTITKSKVITKVQSQDDIIEVKELSDSSDNTVIHTDKCGKHVEKDLNLLNTQLIVENNLEVSQQTSTQQYRSCSPDIFDDEVSSIMDMSKNRNILSQEHRTKVFSQDNLMEMTKCVNTLSQDTNKPSQNATKRKSNDLMEITDCFATSSQPIVNDEDVDLTLSPNAETILNPSPDIDVQTIDSIDIDVSQSPKNLTERKVESEEHKTRDINNQPGIDLTLSSNEETADLDNVNTSKENLNIDLTQSSNSNDDLPFVQLSMEKTSSENTIILDEKEYIGINGKVKSSLIPEKHKEINITQEANTMERISYPTLEKTCDNIYSQSFFDEFVHDHSKSTENEGEKNLNNSVLKNDSDIDLTQDSDISNDSNKIPIISQIVNNSNLGKKDDVSIDYDEIIDITHKDSTTMPSENSRHIIIDENRQKSIENLEDDDKNSPNVTEIMSTRNHDRQSPSKTSQVHVIEGKKLRSNTITENVSIVNITDDYDTEIPNITLKDKERNDLVSNSKQNSEFDISDKELNYSLHKSKLDFNHFDFGGISIMDNITGVQSVAENYSFLPGVIKKDTSPQTNNQMSPCKSNHIKTPKNGDYIIKTNEVTPMLEYASMTTPERNRELDKYGLKRFKRKRAIQLLTHLYNQTHPIVESYTNEDLPSPSKKQRKEPNLPKFSPSKLKSPNKNAISTVEKITSSRSDIKGNGENVCVYEETDEVPDIRNIECGSEDWVFQKREKAKVHSCKVPLHIAFHNYVYSRRGLREAILRYEPVHIDVIHKDLAGYGHRYDPKDLLKFMDKKCITVKTTDNDARNNKRY